MKTHSVIKSEFEKKALRRYYAEKALFEGMQDKMQDTRENEYMEADKSVDAVAHEDGNVYRTALPETGETIFITGGKVVLDSEGYIDVNQSEGLVALMPNGKKEAIKAGNVRDKVIVENAQEQKNVKRAEIDARYKQQLNTFTYTDKADGTEHTVQLVSRGEQMARVILDGVEQDVPNNVFDEIVAEATTENGEVAQAVPAVSPVEENAPVVEQPELSNVEQLPKEKQTPAPIPMEKRGKEERAAYHLVPIERTMEDLHDGTLEPDEIEGLIDARIKEAESDVKAVEKKKPVIGADKNAYVAAKQQWQADMEVAKAKFDYYNQLKAINAEVTRSEMREAVEAVKPRDIVEKTADEFVASVMPMITPESFKKETGLKNSEQKALVGVIAGEGNGGVTIEQAAEIVLENYGDELRALGFNGDVQDVRDMIINILSNGNPRSYAKKGLEMRQQADVEQQKLELESIAIGMNFKDTKEMIGYEEAVVPRIIQDYTGFDETEYFNNLAENIEYDTTRESEGTRGSSELLQGEQSADNAGVADLGEPGQGGEVQGDVYSGGENAAPQGNQQVNSPEIPNSSTSEVVSPVEGVAEGGNAPGQSGVAVPEATNEMQPVQETIDRTAVEVAQGTQNMEPVNEAESVKPRANVNTHSVIKSENEKKALRKRAEKWAKKLGVKVHVLESYDEVTDEQAKEAILEQRVPGWFAGGEVYIYMPHLINEADLDRTIVHESVAHKGVKQMLGEEFGKFLDNVWNAMSVPAKAKFLSYVGAGKNATQADRRAAADEYVAALAEKVYKKQGLTAEEKTIWQKFADWFRKKFNADEVKAEVLAKETLTDEDIAKMIRASYETLQSNKVGNEGIKPINEGRTMFSKTSEQIEELFDKAVAGELTGKAVSVGKLTKAGKEYLESISGLTLKDDIDFVLNPSDLLHIYNNHYGENEKDKGNNIPLNKHDIRRLVDVVAFPTKIVYGIGENGRKSFYFLMDTPGGAYNLLEIYADKRGNLSSKTYYKTKKGVSQRVMNILNSLHSTSMTDGATLSDAKIPQMFEKANTESEKSASDGTKFRKVFHGSGAKFDKFDHSFMGTGEGAQAYGWGTYVTEVEGIGRTYATTMRDKLISEKHRENAIINNLARQTLASNNGDKNAALDDLRNLLNESWSDKKRVKAQIKIIETGKFLPETKLKAHLYNVEIPDDNGSNYLQWKEIVPKEVENAVKERLLEKLSEGQGEAYKSDLKQELDDVFRLSDYSGRSLYNNVSAYVGGDKAASRFLNEMGFVGISYPAEATTGGRKDKARNYVIFNENDAQIESRTMFRKANENQEIFVSNARKAVEEIKQEKATPQQWLAMIKKNGGLKAGEDKWMGLSEWLEEKGKLKGENGKDVSLTKQEVLDFVNENAIKIEEVEYDENAIDIDNVFDEYEEIYDLKGEEEAHKVMIERYGENFFEAFKEIGGELRVQNDKLALQILKNEINSTRLGYTTKGLENKREIALVVPTIEPYNQHDEIHFGDAGNGRAVAWVRFGETTADTDETIAAKKAVNDYLAEMREKYNTLEGEETDAMTAEEIERLQELTAKEIESGEKKARVLVIDEIQSKRHQDAREKGYKTKEDEEIINKQGRAIWEMMQKYNVSRPADLPNVISPEDAVYIEELKSKKIGEVPSAPFEKNWQELAMKRMLRLAAEEGFDKVAWTTGEQQAERYNLGKAFNDIEREDNPNIDGRRFVLNGANVETFQVDENGNIVDSTLAEAKGKPLADVVGKDMAVKMMSLENGDMLEGEDLRIGGEGMKGFYDRMLPSFVSKYTKKWGAKVGTVEMPSLEQNNVMHSVDVTPEMKESVMEGQTMFRKMNEHAEEFNKTHKGGVPVVEIDPNNMEADFAEEGFATEEIEELKERMKKGVAAVYNTDKKIIYLLVPSQDKESVYSTCWHEDTHAAIDILGLTPEMMDEFYSFAQGKKKEAFEALLDKIGYEIEEYPEESLAYGVQAMHILDNWSAETLSKLFGSTAEGAQRQMEIIQPLIDYINNGRQGTQSSVGEVVRDRGMYNNTANQKKTAETEGTGATATGGLTEGGITERTLLSKKELTPEQKKKQKALKENAKAIRRLHNVTSRFPITALRNLGFALETQEQRDMHDRLFAERDAITGESKGVGIQVNPKAMTLQERITEGILKLAKQEKENVEMRLSAIRAYGRDLANAIKLMNAQKGYDRRTVEMFTDLVKMYLRNNAMKGLSSYEIIRLLNLMQKATGGREKVVYNSAVKIAEIITYEHTRQLEEIMDKQMKTVMAQKADGILFKLTFCHL